MFLFPRLCCTTPLIKTQSSAQLLLVQSEGPAPQHHVTWFFLMLCYGWGRGGIKQSPVPILKEQRQSPLTRQVCLGVSPRSRCHALPGPVTHGHPETSTVTGHTAPVALPSQPWAQVSMAGLSLQKERQGG